MLLELALEGDIEIVLNNALAYEYEDVLYRPENRMENWADGHLKFLIDSLAKAATWVETSFSVRPTLKDDSDELVLAAAISGQANMIVTFNIRDFSPAGRFGIRVLQPGDALRLLETS